MAKRTIHSWLRRRWGPLGNVVLPIALLALCPPWYCASAAESVSSNSPSSPAIAARLDYQETDYSVAEVYSPMTRRSEAFRHEPAAAGKVFRGILNFGGGATNDIAFLWQPDAGKLFLDLNRNQDLTDDAVGVYSTGLAKQSEYQTFTNVHLALFTPSGPFPVRVNLDFWDYGMRPACQVQLHSFWQGRVTLAGQDWQVGLIPNLSGKPADSCEADHLLVRPWERHSQPFGGNRNPFDAFSFTRKLFFGGQAYELSSLPVAPAGEFRPVLQFAPQSVPLGDLKITGKFIHRLLLAGDAYMVISDQPGDTLKVPVGNYYPPSVLLEQNGMQARCQGPGWPMQKVVSVTQNAPGVLAAGGPLTNTVSATRHGRDLRLDYLLAGAGGQSYQLANVDRTKPPTFAIFHGGKQIASGNFEFG
jgi:hypothetical protein